mgnify:CR=1 FL=1
MLGDERGGVLRTGEGRDLDVAGDADAHRPAPGLGAPLSEDLIIVTGGVVAAKTGVAAESLLDPAVIRPLAERTGGIERASMTPGELRRADQQDNRWNQ